MEIQQFCFKEKQQQFINSLQDNKKYYRSNFTYYDILLEEEYDKLPQEKDVIYHEISKNDYIETCYNIANRNSPPCIIAYNCRPQIDVYKWKTENSILDPLVFKIF